MEYSFAHELYRDFSAELVKATSERTEHHRDGSFQELPNHHPAYPDDFPPKELLPKINSLDDFIIGWRSERQIDPLTTSGGTVVVIVPIDETHAFLLSPAKFGALGSATGEPFIIGFGYSGFEDVTKWGYENLPSWLWGENGLALDGVLGPEQYNQAP